MVKATAFACSNCRITPGHHKHFPSASSAEGYFTGKKKIDFGEVTIVRSPESKHGYNVGSCHVQEALSSLENCDYFCYKNSTSSVMFINRIVSVEYVNENSSRIHYFIDHYATYIGYLKLGWAFVHRTHVPDYSSVTDFMLDEPISVPKQLFSYNLPVVDGLTEALESDMVYGIWMTSDEKGNANSGDVRIYNVTGSPFYGKLFVVETTSEVENILKSYLNQEGYFVNAVNPTVSNICRIIYCPRDLLAYGEGYTHDVVDTIPFPTVKFPKALTPQFVKMRVVALSSGDTLDFDATKAITATSGVMTFGFSLRGVGGTSPRLGLTINVPYGELSGFSPIQPPVPSGLINIMQVNYPELPISTFMPTAPTLFGVTKNILGGSLAGAAGGGVVGGLGGPAGALAGTVIGGAGGLFSSISAFQNSYQNYTHNGSPDSGYSVSQGWFGWEVAIEMPTSEGFKILEAFFNSFGYNVSRRQQLNLAVRGNFTYIKTAGGITASSDTAPQYSIDQIGLMFDQGLTVWSAEIGSTESCG